MKTRKSICSAIIAAVFVMVCVSAQNISAQNSADLLPIELLPAEASPDTNSKDRVELVINYGNGNETRLESHRGVVAPVSMRSGQMMPFTVQFPSSKVGMPVQIASFDGGEVVGIASLDNLAVSTEGEVTFTYQPEENLFVGNDGTVRFAFRANHDLGLYRLIVQLPGEQHLLQFYVVRYLSPD